MFDYVRYERDVPRRCVDVLVVGGGPAGIGAALASARNGVETTLVERYGFLGGMATAGLIGPFMTSYSLDGEVQIIRGIFDELIRRMEEIGGAIHPSKVREGTSYSAYQVYGHKHVAPFESETLKTVALEMMEEAKVNLMLHTFFFDAIVENKRIEDIIVINKSGLQAIKANVVIDCTGDADIAANSGVPIQKGRESDGLMQPASKFFRIKNVDLKKVERYAFEHPNEKLFASLVSEAKKKDLFPIKRNHILIFETPNGEFLANVSRLFNVDATNGVSLTRAEIEGRKQVTKLMDFFKKYVPGLENVELVQTAPQVGIRESRHIKGEYILTGEDILDSLEFDDVIALNSFPIDIHDPDGSGGRFQGPKNDKYYEIPYRCLIPLNIDQLLVAGRSISATHKAAGSIRVMPPCIATGQAAGTAAALSIKNSISLKKIDIKELQKTLLSQHVYLPKRISDSML